MLLRTWQERGLLARSLWPLARLYGAVVARRRDAFLSGRRRAERIAGLPVVVVGNRIVGGAGKTPTVIALLAHLRRRGWTPGVVSRGHGGAAAGVTEVDADTPATTVGDEPLLIRRRAGTPVVVGRDRVAAARRLHARYPEVDLILADDGLQHLRLARDVEIVVFDERGGGNGWLLPAGPLREPLDVRSTAARTLVLYNAAAPSTPIAGQQARRALAGAVALDAWWRGEPADADQLQALRGRPLRACAAIAQPQRFFAALAAAGLAAEPCPLPDHADYTVLPWTTEQRDVIVTEKDAVKLDPVRLQRERPATRVWVAPLDFHLEPAFLAALDEALQASVTRRREG